MVLGLVLISIWQDKFFCHETWLILAHPDSSFEILFNNPREFFLVLHFEQLAYHLIEIGYRQFRDTEEDGDEFIGVELAAAFLRQASLALDTRHCDPQQTRTSFPGLR